MAEVRSRGLLANRPLEPSGHAGPRGAGDASGSAVSAPGSSRLSAPTLAPPSVGRAELTRAPR